MCPTELSGVHLGLRRCRSITGHHHLRSHKVLLPVVKLQPIRSAGCQDGGRSHFRSNEAAFRDYEGAQI